jgi:prolipoprotein diacylglyceryltransferase
VLALYLALYSLGRFFVEGLRVDPAHEIGPLRLNQVVAAVVFAVSLAALHSLRGRAPQRASSGA